MYIVRICYIQACQHRACITFVQCGAPIPHTHRYTHCKSNAPQRKTFGHIEVYMAGECAMSCTYTSMHNLVIEKQTVKRTCSTPAAADIAL